MAEFVPACGINRVRGTRLIEGGINATRVNGRQKGFFFSLAYYMLNDDDDEDALCPSDNDE